MSARTLIALVLAIVSGGSAAIGYLLLRGSSADSAGVKTQVIVATGEIPRGQMITESMVAVRTWPKDLAPATAVSDMPSVLGRTALTKLVPGEPILSGKLSDRDAGRGLAALIPDGRRAYTIQTSRVASNVAGFIMPGNRVDVLLTLRGGQDDATGGGSSTTLLQAVDILAVDDHLDAPAGNRLDPQQLRSVTLLVTPDQASLLDLGQNMGTLSLSLRNPDDIAQADTAPATVNILRFTQREPVPSDSSTALPSSLGTWTDRTVNWLAAAALAMPKAAALSGLTAASEPRNRKPDILQIQTLRGRHSGAS